MNQSISFFTFNYDTSLQRRLVRDFRAIELFGRGNMDSLITPQRVLHVYGRAGQYSADPIDVAASPRSRRDLDLLRQFTDMLNLAYVASKDTKTIDPHDKQNDEALLQRARRTIAALNAYTCSVTDLIRIIMFGSTSIAVCTDCTRGNSRCISPTSGTVIALTSQHRYSVLASQINSGLGWRTTRTAKERPGCLRGFRPRF